MDEAENIGRTKAERKYDVVCIPKRGEMVQPAQAVEVIPGMDSIGVARATFFKPL